MTDRDYYEILGVPRTADAAALRQAFRTLAKKFHPDANKDTPDAEARFKEINEAYGVLSDPEKRAAYDRYGKAAFQQGGGPQGGFGGGGGFGAFHDLFREFFGEDMEDVFSGRGGGGAGGAGRRPAERGSDLRYDVEITLEEAFAGAEREIVVPSAAPCQPCGGSGAEAGTKPETCPTCQGRGQVLMGDRGGFFRMARTCPACQGRGQVIASPCRSCGGRGMVQRDKRLAVKIPAGVDDGARIRLTGEGDIGPRGGPNGDLYIFLSVRPHQFFERDGRDLFCRATVPMTTAALGGRIEIPTIDGKKTELALPEGTQAGRRFLVRGAGMSALNFRERGDLHVEIAVETPVNLTGRQRKLLEEFQAECGAEAHPQSTGFFDSVRRFFENKAD